MFCAVMGGVSRANGIIDPVMRVLDDEFSNAILKGSTFAPNAGGGGVFGFFNSTGKTITELTFDTFIAPHISPADIALAFVCNDSPANPFFLHCSITYVGATGELTIAFWGTNAITGLEGSSNLVGEHKGIPTVPLSCISNPDAAGCTIFGHFAVSLNDGASLTDTTGGWSHDLNPLLFLPGQPLFTVTEIQTNFGAMPGDSLVPEPATAGTMAAALAAAIWLKRRRTAARQNARLPV